MVVTCIGCGKCGSNEWCDKGDVVGTYGGEVVCCAVARLCGVVTCDVGTCGGDMSKKQTHQVKKLVLSACLNSQV